MSILSLTLIRLAFLKVVFYVRGQFKSSSPKAGKSKKLMKIVNIKEENPHILWTVWEISMTLSGKRWLVIIWKVTKNQGFTISLKTTFSEKPGVRRSNWPSLSFFRANRQNSISYSGLVIWNSIPTELRKASSYGIFRSELKEWQPTNFPCRLF